MRKRERKQQASKEFSRSHELLMKKMRRESRNPHPVSESETESEPENPPALDQSLHQGLRCANNELVADSDTQMSVEADSTSGDNNAIPDVLATGKIRLFSNTFKYLLDAQLSNPLCCALVNFRQ